MSMQTASCANGAPAGDGSGYSVPAPCKADVLSRTLHRAYGEPRPVGTFDQLIAMLDRIDVPPR